MIDRRAFLAGTGAVLLAAPLAVNAQGSTKIYRIGYLASGRSSSPATASELQSFLQGLQDLGYVEGRGFVMEYRWAEGQPDRLPELAADLVGIRVDVIVSPGTPPTFAAKRATQTIPIVFPILGAAVEKGLVASLARPGGNITGLTTQLGALKLSQVLKEAVPTMTRVIYLYAPESSPRGTAESLRSQAQAMNLEWQSVAIREWTGVCRIRARHDWPGA